MRAQSDREQSDEPGERARRAVALWGLAVVGSIVLGAILAIPTHVLPPRGGCSRVRRFEVDAEAIRNAAQMALAEGAGGCPDVEELVRRNYLDRRMLVRARSHRVRCSGDDVAVRSAAEDGVLGTADDVVVGDLAALPPGP